RRSSSKAARSRPRGCSRSCSRRGASRKLLASRRTHKRRIRMDANTFLDALDALVSEKHLLKHPFYVLWTEGKLTVENLRDYAVAYYPHVAAFPRYVSAVHSQSADAALRRELLENLIEEERGDANHPALWRRFAGAVGAAGEDVTPEARLPEVAELVETF